MNSRISRRGIMKSWLAGGILSGVHGTTVHGAPRSLAAGPSSEVTLGVIGLGGINVPGGVGGRGRQLIEAFRGSRKCVSSPCAMWTRRSWASKSRCVKNEVNGSRPTQTCAECWTTETSTRWWSPRQTTGTHWQRSGHARLVRMCISKNHSRTTSGRDSR